MKSLFSVFKSKKQDSGEEPVSGNGHYDYAPIEPDSRQYSPEVTQASVNSQAEDRVYNENYEDDMQIDIQDFIDKAQAYLNSGSDALAEAEEKTRELETIDPSSLEYDDLVEEVRSLQAKAGYDFKQAQTLIKTANSLKEQEAADAN